MNAPAQPNLALLQPASFKQDAHVIGLVGLAHLVSHFGQLLLAPLFPFLKTEFQVGYAELGFLMTIFFVASCFSQALSGFLVDHLGPRAILLAGLALLAVAVLGYSLSMHYWMLAGFSAVAGLGNGVFHPVDFTLLNRKVSSSRLGHAYSVHGITGNFGWALAPALLVPIALVSSWRVALGVAAVFIFFVLGLVWLQRSYITLPLLATELDQNPRQAYADDRTASSLGFLKMPAVWMCFAFFFWYAVVVSVVQAFAPEAARHLHGFALSWVALCLTLYMLGSAGGMVLGGFLVVDPTRCERIVGIGFGMAALVALVLAWGSLAGWVVVVLFGMMGFFSGVAGPSRDWLVKRATPSHATGRVYGVVYSGLDIGQAVAPLVFGALMDHAHYRGVLVGLALMQAVLIASAFNVKRVERVAVVPA